MTSPVRISIKDTSRPNQSITALITEIETKTVRIALSKVGNRYAKFIQNRYRKLASGGGVWPKLKRSTIFRKRRRGIAKNPEWILREGDDILKAVEKRIFKKTVVVGYISHKKHPRSKKSIRQLVDIHSKAGRRIIVPPTEEVKRELGGIISKEIQQTIDRFK